VRVTDRHRYDIVGKRVEDAKGLNAKALETVSTLRRVNRISDDPNGVAAGVGLKDRISANEQFQKNIDFSRGMLERGESALNGMSENLMRLKELSVAMANDTYDHSSRLAAAEEVREIMKELVQLGNTTFNNRYVFSGFRSATPALSMDGKYLGDDGAVMLQVGESQFQQINLQARGLFEASAEERAAGHVNMLDAVDQLLAGLSNNSKDGIQFALKELDYLLDKTASYQSRLGSVSTSLNGATQRAERSVEMDKGNLSLVYDADVFEASSGFRRSESVLQSTLLASSKLLQPSLLNFLQ
jgi:flagellar hook-associated protein 3 FlgL